MIISSIHERCGVFEKKLNIYSKKIFYIDFFESIVVFNINEAKCKISKSVTNNAKNEWAIDYRNNEYFDKTKEIINKKFVYLNKNKLFKKIIRKILYKNFIFQFYENIKLKKIFDQLKK